MWDDVLWFWFTAPWWLVRLSTLSCTYCPLYVFFGKFYIQFFCPLFNQIVYFLLSCMSSWYSLDINPLPDIWFTNIMFFYSRGCLFILLILLLCRSFLAQCSLFIFALFAYAFGVLSKKSLPRPISRKFSPVFFQEFYGFSSYV